MPSDEEEGKKDGEKGEKKEENETKPKVPPPLPPRRAATLSKLDSKDIAQATEKVKNDEKRYSLRRLQFLPSYFLCNLAYAIFGLGLSFYGLQQHLISFSPEKPCFGGLQKL